MLDALPMSAVSEISVLAGGFGVPEVDEDTRVVSGRLRLALDYIHRYNAKMSLSHLQAFLLVAEKEGLTVHEYAKRSRVSGSTMSRALLDLGPKKRTGDAGLGLLKKTDDFGDMRKSHVHLSPLGRKVLEDMVGWIRDLKA